MPLVGHTSDDMFEPAQSCSASLSACFKIGGHGLGGRPVRLTPHIARRDRHQQQCAGRCSHSFGQELGERKLGFEGPGRQVVVPKLARVRHPLVYEDDARRIESQEVA